MNYFNQESERLKYRQLTEKDISSWTEFFVNNDRLHFFGFDLSKPVQELAKDWIHLQIERYKDDNVGHLAVIRKPDNAFIGMTGLLKREIDGEVIYEVAYSLKPNYWGNGYATEMAKTMKRYGVDNMGLNKLISIIHIDNEPSMKVARKNGMQALRVSEFKNLPVIIFGN